MRHDRASRLVDRHRPRGGAGARRPVVTTVVEHDRAPVVHRALTGAHAAHHPFTDRAPVPTLSARVMVAAAADVRAPRSKPKRTHERPVSHLLVRVPNAMTRARPPRCRCGRRGDHALGLEVLRRPDHGLGRGDRQGRPVGTRRDPLRLAAARRLDPAARPRARPHVRRGARRPVTALGERHEVRPPCCSGCERRPARPRAPLPKGSTS